MDETVENGMIEIGEKSEKNQFMEIKEEENENVSFESKSKSQGFLSLIKRRKAD